MLENMDKQFRIIRQWIRKEGIAIINIYGPKNRDSGEIVWQLQLEISIRSIIIEHLDRKLVWYKTWALSTNSTQQFHSTIPEYIFLSSTRGIFFKIEYTSP